MTILLLCFMAYSSFRSGQFSNPKEWLMGELLMLPGILIALSFHEFGHAFVADRLGDDTPRSQGRVSINPAAHIDLIGFIALLFVGFGWGKPVEIDPRNFKKPRRDELLVSVAGVLMNLILAVIFTLVLRFYVDGTGAGFSSGGMYGSIYTMIFYIIYINLILMIFNLLPIPPLDGFNILTEIFDLKRYSWWYTVYDKGFIILMILILFDFTDRILSPCISFFLNLLSYLM